MTERIAFDLERGKLYDFHTCIKDPLNESPMVYIGAEYLCIDGDKGVLIRWKAWNLAQYVYTWISQSEWDWAEDHDPDRPMTEIFK